MPRDRVKDAIPPARIPADPERSKRERDGAGGNRTRAEAIGNFTRGAHLQEVASFFTAFASHGSPSCSAAVRALPQSLGNRGATDLLVHQAGPGAGHHGSARPKPRQSNKSFRVPESFDANDYLRNALGIFRAPFDADDKLSRLRR